MKVIMKIKIHSYEVIATCQGEGNETVLLLHGGPGLPSNYLLDAHSFLTDFGYKIATWDQLGCGMSDKPSDPSLWRIERFVEEVEIVRKALKLENVYLLGHSWGGINPFDVPIYVPRRKMA
jgi:proline iminopeptidase